MNSLGIVQWNSTRRDHPGNPDGVSGPGLVNNHQVVKIIMKNKITINIEMVIPYSEANNVPYQIPIVNRRVNPTSRHRGN